MRILLAEDDAVTRRLLEKQLHAWGYDVIAAGNGREALDALEEHSDIGLAVLDWLMPEVDGVEVCRSIRRDHRERPIYLVLCTSRSQVDDVIRGLDAGADDYLCKPLDPRELRARLRVGVRTARLETELRHRIRELDEAIAHVRQLQGLLPICVHCRRIRDGADVWHKIENYLEAHADVEFSHGLCERCLKKHYPGFGRKS